MLIKLANFFRPPSFPDEEKTRLARILYTIQIALASAALLAALNSLRIGLDSAVQGILAACTVIFVTIWMTRRGYLRLASWVILLTITAAVTYLHYVGQGIHDITMMLFPLVIIIASLLFDRISFAILNLLVFAAIAFLVHAEVSGAISTDFGQFTDYGDLIFLALEQALVAIVTRLLARNITQSLHRARKNELILAEANRQLSEQTKSLRASQELLSEAQRIGNIGHFKLDLVNQRLTWSDQMYRIHDLEPGQIEITPEIALDFVHPDDRQAQMQAAEQLTQAGHLVTTHRIITFAGIERQTIRTTNLVRDAKEQPEAIVGTIQDITERQQTEVSLQRYAHRLEVLRQLDYAILAARSVSEIALEVVQRIRELAPCWRASISTFDFKANQATLIAYSEKDDPAQTVSVRIPLTNFLDLPTLHQGQPVYTDYLAALSDERPAIQRLLSEGTRSLLGLPIIIQDELVGSLNLEANQPAAFIAEHIEIGQEVTGLLGIALQQARLVAQTTEALERETRLNALARAISSTLDLPLLLQGIMHLAIELISADAGTLSLISEDGARIIELYDWNIPPPLSDIALPKERGVTWFVIKSGQPLMLIDYSSHPNALPELVAAGISTLVGTPVIAGEICLGALILLGSGANKKFSQRDLALLESIGRQAGIAIQNARLYNALQEELAERLSAEESLRQAAIQRQKAEEKVRELNIVLEQRVRERTAELEASNKELEAFAYSVSHDLRAPLRGIDGYSKLLLEDYESTIDTEGQFYLQSIRGAAQKMGQLIDDLLQLSRVTRTEMRRATVNLSAQLSELCAALREQEPERQVQIIIQPGMEAQGDANLLRIMLYNLLGNAWKFTNKVAQARIEIGWQLQDGQLVYFVRDNGAGFDMKYADRLFRAFQRFHNPTEFEGTGIGLATVQRVITRHGGRIWAEAAVDQGAIFYFTLGK